MTDLTADQVRGLQETYEKAIENVERFHAEQRAKIARAERKKSRRRVKAARRANR